MTDEDRAQKEAEHMAEQDDREQEFPRGALWTGEPIEIETLWYPTEPRDD